MGSMQTTVYGKTILAGEHAVLRGSPALVVPVFARALVLSFQETTQPLTIAFSGPHGNELNLLFWGVIEKAMEMTRLNREEVKGRFNIENSIPVGAGMGASAALCVAISQWFEWKGLVSANELPEFARQLENLFHGESSGVDIAVALSGSGLKFVRGGERSPLKLAWQPKWFVSYSGRRGVTSECIQKVRELAAANPELAARIDEQMKEAVLMAEKALLDDSQNGLETLAKAIEKARDCFEKWGLAGGESGAHMASLIEHGALAVKPTGSGNGGFVLSLWRQDPPAAIKSSLIPL